MRSGDLTTALRQWDARVRAMNIYEIGCSLCTQWRITQALYSGEKLGGPRTPLNKESRRAELWSARSWTQGFLAAAAKGHPSSRSPYGANVAPFVDSAPISNNKGLDIQRIDRSYHLPMSSAGAGLDYRATVCFKNCTRFAPGKACLRSSQILFQSPEPISLLTRMPSS